MLYNIILVPQGSSYVASPYKSISVVFSRSLMHSTKPHTQFRYFAAFNLRFQTVGWVFEAGPSVLSGRLLHVGHV